MEKVSTKWMKYAACRDMDPDLFFSDGEGHKGVSNAKTKAAREVCMGCSVRVSCLNYALEMNEYTGMWGGLTPRERRKVKYPKTSSPQYLRPQQTEVL